MSALAFSLSATVLSDALTYPIGLTITGVRPSVILIIYSRYMYRIGKTCTQLLFTW
jgi:hypothetical protein